MRASGAGNGDQTGKLEGENRSRAAEFRRCLASVLADRPDVTLDEIARQFGVSLEVLRRVIEQYDIQGRTRGPRVKSWSQEG
jgi:transposase-like protein